MTNSISCDQCDAIFESNYRLFKHKSNQHGPTVAIINKTLKRSPKSAPLNAHPQKYIKVGDEPASLRGRRPRSTEPLTDVREQPADVREHLPDVREQSRESSVDSVENSANFRGKSKRSRRITDSSVDSVENSSNFKGKSKRTRRITDSSSERGVKRSRDSNSEESYKKYRRIQQRGFKRLLPDQNRGPAKYRRIANDSEINHHGNYGNLIKKLKSEIAKWKRLYKSTNRKMNQLETDCMDKIKVLKQQLIELEEMDDDYELNAISKAVINNVTIGDFNKIRSLMSNGQLGTVLRSNKLILALQKLFLGLSYGVIPITSPQRVALSTEDRDLIRNLENGNIDNVRSFISTNKDSFERIFNVIDASIKLVTKSYAKYGGD